MRIGQNGPLEKLIAFLFMRLNVTCIANIWHDNIYADTNLCDCRLTRINKTRAEKCRFMVCLNSSIEVAQLVASGVDIRQYQYQVELKLLEDVVPFLASFLLKLPTHFKDTRFFVDRFHWRGHISCSSGYSVDKYAT